MRKRLFVALIGTPMMLILVLLIVTIVIPVTYWVITGKSYFDWWMDMAEKYTTDYER